MPTSRCKSILLSFCGGQKGQRRGKVDKEVHRSAAIARSYFIRGCRFSDERSMRALSIRQPFAELILRGIKTSEFTSRSTRIIGERFYIYASKGKFRGQGSGIRSQGSGVRDQGSVIRA